jgi:transcriptional regulator with XRE-family HTH domain
MERHMSRQFSGTRLRAARIAAGLKPEQLALRIDRSVYSIHQYERDAVSPPAPVLGALAEAFGCTIDDLFSPAAPA